ncbi:MAG TPA: hypothetical protein VGR47_13675 [Terracidiphilus sp.]|nr:hypothetical protein [Terracidiphilus sp.]
MDEENFFESRGWRPFGTQDAARIEAQWRRFSALGQALWGSRSEHLERQLQLSHPEIPAGFALEDFRELLKFMDLTTRHSWARSWSDFSQTVSVGTEELTRWEARRQIVIRAIEYLEKP